VTAALVCPNHPDREGVGICVSCRRVVCADCATKLDGINHCKQCLEKKIGKAREPAAPFWRRAERLFALGGVAGAFCLLFAAYAGIGFAAADIEWFGSGPGDTARALADASDALRRFQRDVGRFPSEREGLRALLDDEPVPGAPAIDKWRGPYLRPRKEGTSEDSALADGYGSRLRYVYGPGRRRPGVLSIGANRELDTDTSALRMNDPADGDDRIQWVQ
jgi:hypothetical protein